MLLWNLYFIIKFGLHIAGQIVLNPLWNILLFAALIVSNLPSHQNKPFKLLRSLAFIGPAIALLLYETGLVISWALLEQIKTLLGFSIDYLWELFKRTIEPWMIWGTLICYILIRILDRYMRISTWVFFGLITMLFHTLNSNQPNSPETIELASESLARARENLSPAELLALGQIDFQKLRAARDQVTLISDNDQNNPNTKPDNVLRHFFNQQRTWSPTPFTPISTPDFDVIILQICSLSWTDLQQAKQRQHPLIQQADFIFENFNSATSYSGPAAIRLLRGKCGQTPHKALYDATENRCMLFDHLRLAGFEIEMGLNHDGRFQNFNKQVEGNLGGGTPKQRVTHNETPIGVQAFDGSMVSRDGDYLRSWWRKRIQQSGPAVAYYYNSITLHDGNRLLNSTLNSLDSYPLRLERMLDDIQSVLTEIKRSEKKALVLVVPEHGAALTGAYSQLIGLRELPTPSITKVPVFGYWIAPGYIKTLKSPIAVKQPTSYSALTELLNRWLNQSGEQRIQPVWSELLSNLPTTRFVAQQGNITVIANQGAYWLKAPGAGWKALGSTQATETP